MNHTGWKIAVTWESLTPVQRSIMGQGQGGHAFSIGDWEDERRRQANLLVDAGLLICGGPDRFNGHTCTYSLTVVGQAFLHQQFAPKSDLASTGLSRFTPDQQLRIHAALVTHFYDRTRRLMIELETARGNRGNYGTTVMNDEDRLFNRVMAALVETDLGIPAHDDEALQWLASVLDSPA